MQLSLWANRGNRNREERNGIRVFTTFLVIDASMKGLPNFCAVILINLVVDILGGICPIQSGTFLRTASLFTTVNHGAMFVLCGFPIPTMAVVGIMGGHLTQLRPIRFSNDVELGFRELLNM